MSKSLSQKHNKNFENWKLIKTCKHPPPGKLGQVPRKGKHPWSISTYIHFIKVEYITLNTWHFKYI